MMFAGNVTAATPPPNEHMFLVEKSASRVFEDIFCTGGGKFDQSNLKKFKFPGSARGIMLKFRIDRYIIIHYFIQI
jgi:hypothetical protein